MGLEERIDRELFRNGELGRGGNSIVYASKLENGRRLAFKVSEIASRELHCEPDKTVKVEYVKDDFLLIDGNVYRFNKRQLSKLKNKVSGALCHKHVSDLPAVIPRLASYFVTNDKKRLCLVEEIACVDGFTPDATYLGLPIRKRIDLIKQASITVQKINSRRVLHRDIKPKNMMVTRGGYLQIIDFDIAKKLDGFVGGCYSWQNFLKILDPEDECLGTPEYMSTITLEGREDVKCDVYALGISAAEIITDELPLPPVSSLQELYNYKNSASSGLGDKEAVGQKLLQSEELKELPSKQRDAIIKAVGVTLGYHSKRDLKPLIRACIEVAEYRPIISFPALRFS